MMNSIVYDFSMVSTLFGLWIFLDAMLNSWRDLGQVFEMFEFFVFTVEFCEVVSAVKTLVIYSIILQDLFPNNETNSCN